MPQDAPRTVSTVCANCGAHAEIHHHQYYEGTHQNPYRTWLVEAPLRYLNDKGYCSPECVVGRSP